MEGGGQEGKRREGGRRGRTEQDWVGLGREKGKGVARGEEESGGSHKRRGSQERLRRGKERGEREEERRGREEGGKRGK